ncbi:MAG: hypothetical protein DWQ34_12115 [Planctomycetota bacterium]|nr:MAG: hypothetical protein DWQ29_13640 [Planctomycetota bacterium]REJ92939.1 MAG: hypothetical protein DWQ34_12115 [Planctomycetota bacterium]REK26131.1 MAG: hypothetical protein DWQ41_10775 [Planctomycetota bacterium]REK33501.1 MAG: hypothetical protein DWQ45_15045 [Planctomycetota bacterium]
MATTPIPPQRAHTGSIATWNAAHGTHEFFTEFAGEDSELQRACRDQLPAGSTKLEPVYSALQISVGDLSRGFSSSTVQTPLDADTW